MVQKWEAHFALGQSEKTLGLCQGSPSDPHKPYTAPLLCVRSVSRVVGEQGQGNQSRGWPSSSAWSSKGTNDL